MARPAITPGRQEFRDPSQVDSGAGAIDNSRIKRNRSRRTSTCRPRFSGKWVAYHGREPVAFGRSDVESYQECFRCGLKRGKFSSSSLDRCAFSCRICSRGPPRRSRPSTDHLGPRRRLGVHDRHVSTRDETRTPLDVVQRDRDNPSAEDGCFLGQPRLRVPTRRILVR